MSKENDRFWDARFLGAIVGAGASVGAALHPASLELAPDQLAIVSALTTFAGTAVGQIYEYLRSTYPSSRARSQFAAISALFAKAQEDFSGAILVSPNKVDDALAVIRRRLSLSNSLGYRSWEHDRFLSPKSFRRYMGPFGYPRMAPLPQSVELIHELGPLTINSGRIHVGIELALLIMIEDFGLPLIVNDSFADGLRQIKYLNLGHEADFVFMADANVFMAAERPVTNGYWHLLPIMWNKHYLIERPNIRSFHERRLYFAEDSSGHEQAEAQPKSISSYISHEKRPFDVSDLPEKIRSLDRGQGLIAWSPIV